VAARIIMVSIVTGRHLLLLWPLSAVGASGAALLLLLLLGVRRGMGYQV
jgi:hypothetical protein